VLDHLPTNILEQLVITQEHEGGISFVWKFSVPRGYEEDGSIDGGGDDWSKKVVVRFMVVSSFLSYFGVSGWHRSLNQPVLWVTGTIFLEG